MWLNRKKKTQDEGLHSKRLTRGKSWLPRSRSDLQALLNDLDLRRASPQTLTYILIDPLLIHKLNYKQQHFWYVLPPSSSEIQMDEEHFTGKALKKIQIWRSTAVGLVLDYFLGTQES